MKTDDIGMEPPEDRTGLIGGDKVSWSRFKGAFSMNSYRVPTFWGKYWMHLVGAITIIVLLSGLIVLPSIQAYRYRTNIQIANDRVLPIGDAIRLEKNAADIENATRVTLAQIIAGLILLAGLYFTYQNVIATRENLRITEEGKITERFGKSIEMLSSSELDVRLGGIYALERIAGDSVKDHRTVMEILCAFIRENTPRDTDMAAQPNVEKRFV